MAWRRPGDKPLSEPIMVRLPTHICVTRPQWLNSEYDCLQLERTSRFYEKGCAKSPQAYLAQRSSLVLVIVSQLPCLSSLPDGLMCDHSLLIIWKNSTYITTTRHLSLLVVFSHVSMPSAHTALIRPTRHRFFTKLLFFKRHWWVTNDRNPMKWNIVDFGHLSYVMHQHEHYSDVIMATITSQITSLTIVYSIVYADADQRKHQSSASLAFRRGTHRGPVSFPHKRPVLRKMFPFDDIIME